MKSFLLLLVLLISSCTDPKEDRFDMRPADIRFFEYVSETKGVFVEYLIVSNGMMLEKRHAAGSNIVRVGSVGARDAGALIDEAQRGIEGKQGGIVCNGCDVYHAFYGDAAGAKAESFIADDVPEHIPALGSKAEGLAKNIDEAEVFYIHFLYQKQGREIMDYHFFPDGTVIVSRFGEANGDLKGSQFYSIFGRDISWMKSTLSDEAFSSVGDSRGCPAAGYSWGQLELYRSGRYASIDTCGTGASPADLLFKELEARTGT